MKAYRFVTENHQDIFAETLDDAIEAFNEMKQAGLSPKLDIVSRIEARDEKGEYARVDHPLRAGNLAANKVAISMSA